MVLRRILVGSSWTRPFVETERSDNHDFRTFLTLKRAFSYGGNDKKDALFETREHPWAPVDTRGHPRQCYGGFGSAPVGRDHVSRRKGPGTRIFVHFWPSKSHFLMVEMRKNTPFSRPVGTRRHPWAPAPVDDPQFYVCVYIHIHTHIYPYILLYIHIYIHIPMHIYTRNCNWYYGGFWSSPVESDHVSRRKGPTTRIFVHFWPLKGHFLIVETRKIRFFRDPWAPVAFRERPRQFTIRIFMYVCA